MFLDFFKGLNAFLADSCVHQYPKLVALLNIGHPIFGYLANRM
jgi:hypothetical protein